MPYCGATHNQLEWDGHRGTQMSTLAVIGFDDESQADEVRVELLKLQRDHLIDIEDAAIAVKKADGTMTLHQTYSLPTAGAVGGGFWGLLIGTLFLNPLLGAVAGATAGAAASALADIGIEDDFIRDLAATLHPGSSALFVLLRRGTPEDMLEALQGRGARVLQTSLSHHDQARLRRALAADTSTRRAS